MDDGPIWRGTLASLRELDTQARLSHSSVGKAMDCQRSCSGGERLIGKIDAEARCRCSENGPNPRRCPPSGGCLTPCGSRSSRWWSSMTHPNATTRKRIDARSALDAIIFRLRSGCQWNQLPHEFPDDSSVHRTLGVFAYPPETVYSFRGDMQKPPGSQLVHHFMSSHTHQLQPKLRRCSLPGLGPLRNNGTENNAKV
jgi:transposase